MWRFPLVTSITRRFQPLALDVQVSDPRFGKTASVQVDVTAYVFGKPTPHINVSLLHNNKSIGNQSTDSNGRFSSRLDISESGSQEVKAVADLTDSKQGLRKEVSDSTVFDVASLTPKAYNQGIQNNMSGFNVLVNDQSFGVGETVLFPLLGSTSVDVTYPLLVGGVYNLDDTPVTVTLTENKVVLKNYNAPGRILGSFSFAVKCLKKEETVSGKLNLSVLDIGGKKFGSVPLNIGGITVTTDSEGQASIPVSVKGPGEFVWQGVTVTPVAARESFSITFTECVVAAVADTISCGPIMRTITNPEYYNGKTIVCSGCNYMISAVINDMQAILNYAQYPNPDRLDQTIGAYIACHPHADSAGWWTLNYRK